MRLRTLAWIVLVLLATGSALAASPTRIKLATLAPDGSPWHRGLEQMGADWAQAADGRIRLVLYPGGVAGDDADMLRKMRIGQLQAAALTVIGLADLDPSFNVFTIPLFFESFEEMVYVRDRLTPALRARLETKGWILLHWGHGGWLRFFSREPVRTVNEVQQLKIFTTAGDPVMAAIYKDNGFHPVPLSPTDIMTGLQTGMIDGLPTTPLAALALQWYRHAPNMLDAPIAPLVGATVVSARTWRKIDKADRETMQRVALETQHVLDEEIPAKDDAAIAEMTDRGLTVVPRAEGEEARRWEQIANGFTRLMASVPPEILAAAQAFREEFREQAASPP